MPRLRKGYLYRRRELGTPPCLLQILWMGAREEGQRKAEKEDKGERK